MKHLPALAALIAVLCLSGVSHADPPLPTIVYPTGEFPNDVQNVQAAIDLGGTVLLKATDAAGHFTPFNFGPPLATNGDGRAVILTTDVELLGETVSRHMTTIRGGYMPVRGESVSVKAAIRGIQFEGPMYAAIHVTASNGIEITGNVIKGVVDLPATSEARAVLIANPPPSQVTGRIVVASNLISTDPEHAAGVAFGVTIVGADADVAVLRNIVTDTSSEGITVYVTGRADVWANLVVPGGPGAPNHNPAGNGLSVRTPLEGGAYIRDNVVACVNPLADGIYLIGELNFAGNPVVVSGGVIENNTVMMHGSLFGGIALYGTVRNTRISGNRISGDGAYALQVTFFGDPAAIASSNRFVGNGISDFTASVADVFFDINAIDNLAFGPCASVLDLGAGNQYTCRHGRAAGGAEGRTSAPSRKLDPARPMWLDRADWGIDP